MVGRGFAWIEGGQNLLSRATTTGSSCNQAGKLRKGGQNGHIGRDPVFLPRVGAVSDALKFLYHFQMVVVERKYLGFDTPNHGRFLPIKETPHELCKFTVHSWQTRCFFPPEAL
jgi:hypothetical protein